VALANGNIGLIDWRTGDRRTLIGHNSDATHIVFHPSGSVMVSTSWDGSSRFWDTGTGRPLFTTYEGLAMEFDSAGGRLAFIREGSGFGIWDVQEPVGFAKFNLPLRDAGRVLNVAFSPDESLLGTCDESAWYVYAVADGRLLHQGAMARPRSVLFSPDGGRILVSGREGLRRYQIQHGTDELVVTPEPIPGNIGSEQGFERAAQTPDGRRIVVVGRDKGYLLDGATLQPLFKFGDEFGLLVAPVLSPDAGWIAASTWKGAGLFLWNGETQKLLGRLMGESSLMDFSPSGDRLITSNLRGYQVWDTDGWKLLHQEKIDAGSSSPGPVCFHPDGSLVALAANRQGIALINPTNGTRMVGLTSPDQLNLSWLAFSPSGRRRAAATEECDVHRWDLNALGPALKQNGHARPE
jgi:WD40 repeat protein